MVLDRYVEIALEEKKERLLHRGNRTCTDWNFRERGQALYGWRGRGTGEDATSKGRKKGHGCKRPFKILRSLPCRNWEPLLTYAGKFWDWRQRSGLDYLQQAAISDPSFQPTSRAQLNSQPTELKQVPSCPRYEGAWPGVESVPSMPSSWPCLAGAPLSI